MEKIKKIFTSKTVKRFLWTAYGSVLAIALTTINGIQLPSNPNNLSDLKNIVIVAVVVSIITGLTKEVNNHMEKMAEDSEK